jgi:hypothetical protein
MAWGETTPLVVPGGNARIVGEDRVSIFGFIDPKFGFKITKLLPG